jgi:hypothetical protein
VRVVSKPEDRADLTDGLEGRNVQGGGHISRRSACSCPRSRWTTQLTLKTTQRSLPSVSQPLTCRQIVRANELRQIRPSTVPPKRLPFRYDLSVHSRRGEIVETVHHNEAGMLAAVRKTTTCRTADVQLCLGIQDLLDNANVSDPAQIEAYQMYRSASLSRVKLGTMLILRRNDRPAYDRRIKIQANERRPQ